MIDLIKSLTNEQCIRMIECENEVFTLKKFLEIHSDMEDISTEEAIKLLSLEVGEKIQIVDFNSPFIIRIS